MARYIDADALIKKIYPMGIGDGMYTINAKAVKFAIDNAPTADVVPKSEVDKAEAEIERLQTILDSYALQYGTVRDQQKVIDKAKSEVALDVIRKVKNKVRKYKHNVVNPYEHIILYLNELEKKYTEENK